MSDRSKPLSMDHIATMAGRLCEHLLDPEMPKDTKIRRIYGLLVKVADYEHQVAYRDAFRIGYASGISEGYRAGRSMS